ncbi:MAG TPA: SAM-dependent methyltransferase [Streptosporangiaceae bacterium]|nr:SAM-dependent methyltransferase [Streptosporangiaceae bacterium]
MMTNRCWEVVVSENPASPRGGAQEELMARVDTSVPVSARIWNYRMGGTDYYPIDKEAARRGADPSVAPRPRHGRSPCRSRVRRNRQEALSRVTAWPPPPGPAVGRGRGT